MKGNFKYLLAALLLAVALVFTACGGGDGNGDTQAEVPAVTPPADTAVDPDPAPGDDVVADDPVDEVVDEGPVRDLGGREVIIGNWWGSWDVETAAPTTLAGEARLDDRIYVMERYNFRMREVQLGGWGEIQELATMSILAGDPAATIFILEPTWWAALNLQNMWAPLDFIDFRDTSQYNWNQTIINATRNRDDVPFGWTREVQEGGGIFYNMRLFEEAGLDRYLLFDLQAAGEWTWDAFMDIARQLTRDLTGDGIMDTWAIATFSSDILPRALASNNAKYIGRDVDGYFYNATTTPQFLEALTFVNNLQHVENVQMPQPPDSEWNWFDYAFLNAQVAMRTSGTFMASAINQNLDDDFGFVMFPVGPSGDTHRFLQNANVFAIPSTFSDEEVYDIMFAYLMWQRPLPGFDDPDGWKAGAYLNHTTPRSVDETLALFSRDGSRHSPAFHHWSPGFDEGPRFSWRMWHEDSDPAQIIEEAQHLIAGWLEEANQR